MQQRVAADILSRVTAIELTGAYALGADGYAVIGPVAEAVGAARVLAFAAAYSTLSSAVVLTLPAIRHIRWPASVPTAQSHPPPAPDHL